jgi:hypothetical protein
MKTKSHLTPAPRFLSKWRSSLRGLALSLLAVAGSSPAVDLTQALYILTDSNQIVTATQNNTTALSAPVAITGITMGETLVAIDVRPQNEGLYGLGVDATANTATLYHI